MVENDIYIGLIHHPVLDKEGRIITTAVTNLDLHDLARLSRTYGLRGCYIVQPLLLQRRLVERVASYWQSGPGGGYNITRQQAFESLRLVETIEQSLARIEQETGVRPRVVVTTARERGDSKSCGEVSALMEEGGSWLIVFGTGWGIAPEFFERHADYVLEPIEAGSDYNHLSVRTAAAIIIDRLAGSRRRGLQGGPPD